MAAKRKIKKTDSEEERREQFISILSHQLRTPLSIVRGYLEALASQELGTLNEQQLEYVTEAQHINEDMTALVNKYVDAMNTRADTITPKKTIVNVSDLVARTAKHFESYTKAQNIEIQTALPKKEVSVSTDAHLLKSILDTLIQNSMKYTIGSGSITLHLRETKEHIVIEVEDEGVGIPEEQQQDVFKKFFRAKNIIHRSIAGSGLGLFVAREYVTALGGDITFSSQEGKGTRMQIAVPKH